MVFHETETPQIGGRNFIPDAMIAEQPHLLQMIQRQSNYWRRDILRRGYYGPEGEQP